MTPTQSLVGGVIVIVVVFLLTLRFMLARPDYVVDVDLAVTSARTPAPPTPAPTLPSDKSLVFFLVMPSLLPPEDRSTQAARAHAVQYTWAAQLPPKRVFYVQWFGTHDPVIENREQLLVVPAGHHNATYASRVLWALQQLAERFDPAFVVKGDDVTYFLVPNVLRYLSGKKPSDAVFEGHLLQGPLMARPFASAGAGYILSRPVLKALNQAVRSQHDCLSREHGAEDLTIARCLDELLALRASAALGADGRDLFNAFSPLTLMMLEGGIYNFPIDWYESYRTPFGGVKTGEECCSRRSLSFHYMVPREMFALHSSLVARRLDTDRYGEFSPETQFDVLAHFLTTYLQYHSRD
jgi:hypothetical protein